MTDSEASMNKDEILNKIDLRIENLQQNLHALALMQQKNIQISVQTKDLLLQQLTESKQQQCINPLNRCGAKVFSQTDEDGITLEILRRLGLKVGNYAEFGVGNGLENNTLLLAAQGWQGFWVGGEDLAFNYRKSKRFFYQKSWVTLENIVQLAKIGMREIGAENMDVVSLDLDGNDIYFVEALLSGGVIPKVFIVEYNAKFPPPIKFKIKYDPAHQWKSDDYFGAALMDFAELFDRRNYQLVCCNAHTGANAFFVKKEFSDLFGDVPSEISKIYMPPRYFLYDNYANPTSAKTVEQMFDI